MNPIQEEEEVRNPIPVLRQYRLVEEEEEEEEPYLAAIEDLDLKQAMMESMVEFLSGFEKMTPTQRAETLETYDERVKRYKKMYEPLLQKIKNIGAFETVTSKQVVYHIAELLIEHYCEDPTSNRYIQLIGPEQFACVSEVIRSIRFNPVLVESLLGSHTVHLDV